MVLNRFRLKGCKTTVAIELGGASRREQATEACRWQLSLLEACITTFSTSLRTTAEDEVVKNEIGCRENTCENCSAVVGRVGLMPEWDRLKPLPLFDEQLSEKTTLAVSSEERIWNSWESRYIKMSIAST